MSKKEFKVGDEVYVILGKISFYNPKTDFVNVNFEFKNIRFDIDSVFHAPVKDEAVYEYKYLYKTLDGSWGETLGYYISKKDALGLDQTLKDVQRLTHTKRIRK